MPTVRVRIMLWFTLMMAVELALAIVFMAIVAHNSGGDAERLLVGAVSYNVDELDYDGGMLDIDVFDIYRSGVFTQVFDPAGKLLVGAQNIAFIGDDVFENAVIRRVLANGEEYLVLDQYVDNPDGAVWIRGVTSVENASDALGVVARIAIVLLPVLAVLTLLGGWFIAGRAMAPVRQITRIADEIGDGDDLSARIGLKPGRDEIHRLAATFDRMFARLERSFQAEKQFASDASHELRTPIAVILAECELAAHTADTADDYAESIAVIERQANGMSRLVEGLLRSARLMQGTERADFQPQDVGEIISACCEDARIASPGTEIQTQLEPRLIASVDAALMARLVQNLLENAVKYGGGKVEVSAFTANDGTVCLRVSDNGAGISKGDMEKIWQRFWRADAARTQGDGSGLGLYLVRQIAEAHGGSIRCESTPGKGTAFLVSLPPVKAEHA